MGQTVLPAPSSGGRTTVGGNGVRTLPDDTARGTLASSAEAAFTYGAWVQMVAATAEELYIVGLALNKNNSGGELALHLQVGAGAAGAEVPIVTSYIDQGAVNLIFGLPWPVRVASGSRLALRASDSVVSAIAHLGKLLVVRAQDLL